MSSTSSSESLLARLERHAGRPFARREEMKMILDIAVRHNRAEELDRLSFLAKFLVRTGGIIRRIGHEGEGYNRLTAEFSLNMESARALLMDFARLAPEPVRAAFAERYCAMTPAALDEVLTLFQDLSWFKNWRIDHPEERAWKEMLP